MNQGFQLMELGSAAMSVAKLVEIGVRTPRDLTREEAANLVRYTLLMQCAALEIERMALGIPEKARG